MTITKNAYTPIYRSPSSLHRLARNELNAIAFDLLNWEGSRERVVSAWKHVSAGALTTCGEGDEVAQLYDAVEKDVGEAIALHDINVDESGSDEREVNEWYQAYADLANNYGFYGWPELALADYLCGFGGYDEAKARAVAQRAWETARMVYDARKLAEKKPAEKPKKKAA